MSGLRVGAALLAAAVLLAGCTSGSAPEPTKTPVPTLPVRDPDEGPHVPGVRAPGRGPFVDADTNDLWAVRSEGCGCPDPHHLVAYYRDGSVLAASYLIEGTSLATTNATEPYRQTLQSLLDRANPWGSHDDGAPAGRSDRGVKVLQVWTGTLAQSDLDGVGGYLTGAVRAARDAPTTANLDCLCKGLRIETFGGFQGRADEGADQVLEARWAAVAEQMRLLEDWVR